MCQHKRTYIKQERRLKRLITLGGLEIGIQHQIVNALELSPPPPPPPKKQQKNKNKNKTKTNNKKTKKKTKQKKPKKKTNEKLLIPTGRNGGLLGADAEKKNSLSWPLNRL